MKNVMENQGQINQQQQTIKTVVIILQEYQRQFLFRINCCIQENHNQPLTNEGMLSQTIHFISLISHRPNTLSDHLKKRERERTIINRTVVIDCKKINICQPLNKRHRGRRQSVYVISVSPECILVFAFVIFIVVNYLASDVLDIRVSCTEF